MTSKEKKALEALYLGIYSQNEMANYFDLVSKALDRLESLENENDELLDKKLELVVKNKQQDMFIEKLIQENEKLKNVIEILKDKRINLVFFRACKDIKEVNLYRSVENKLTQQEYELLKEVLENEKN